MYLRVFVTITLLGIFSSVNAQKLTGHVFDNVKEPIVGATVIVRQGDTIEQTTATDIDGKFDIELCDPGYCDVQVSYPGYKTIALQKISISTVERTHVGFMLRQIYGNSDNVPDIRIYKRPSAKYDTSSLTHYEELRHFNPLFDYGHLIDVSEMYNEISLRKIRFTYLYHREWRRRQRLQRDTK